MFSVTSKQFGGSFSRKIINKIVNTIPVLPIRAVSIGNNEDNEHAPTLGHENAPDANAISLWEQKSHNNVGCGLARPA